MALNALTLSTTQGVQGRPFQAAISGLTTGKVEVLGDASPGFSVVNGNLMSQGLPYPVSTVALREYEPGVGVGYRDTRIEIVAASQASLMAQALAAIGVGRKLARYRVAGTRQPDGSIAYSVVVEDDLGATVPQPVGSVTPTPTPIPSPTLNGVVPSYGLVSATADGSTGQTYTLNAAWTNVQWYRMKLASPVSFTAIPGATSATYVSQAADEGYRLAVAGVESGANRAAKSYHVVLPPPVILEDFESLTNWTAANGADVQLATDSPAYGTKRLQVTSTGTVGATATKNDIGSFDTSLLGTIAVLGDVGMDAGRQTGGMSVVLKRFGALQAGPTFGTLYETPSPLLMGKLWGAMHVSDNASLNSPGGGTVGLVVGPTGDIPHSKVTKFDALLGKAGGRATIAIVFDDLKITQYTFAYPLMKSLGIPGGINFVGTTSSNSSAFDMPKIREVYADGWDVNLDSTYNDNITSSFGTCRRSQS
jgi:hypothetical protein